MSVHEVTTPNQDEYQEHDEDPYVNIPSSTNHGHSVYDAIVDNFVSRYVNNIGNEDGRGNAYGYYDLNNDGQDELLLADTYMDDEGEISVYNVCAIYTVVDHIPVLVAEDFSRNTYLIHEDGNIFHAWSIGAAYSVIEVLRLNDTSMLEGTNIPVDQLGEYAQIDFIVPYDVHPQNYESIELSYDEILSELKYLGSISCDEYTSKEEFYNECVNQNNVTVYDGTHNYTPFGASITNVHVGDTAQLFVRKSMERYEYSFLLVPVYKNLSKKDWYDWENNKIENNTFENIITYYVFTDLIVHTDGTITYNDSYVASHGDYIDSTVANDLYLNQFALDYSMMEVPMP